MKNSSKLRLAAAMALGLGAAALATSQASAGTCQGPKVSWEEQSECGDSGGSRAGISWGGVNSSGNKTLTVWVLAGDFAQAAGYNRSGDIISNCRVIDDIVNENSVTRSSGCNSAVKHRVQAGD